MRTPRPATREPTREPGCRPDPVPITRTRQSLLNALETIDSEGWDGPTGTTLLQSLRTELVRPLAIDTGLRGRAAPPGALPARKGLEIGQVLGERCGVRRERAGDRPVQVRLLWAVRS